MRWKGRHAAGLVGRTGDDDQIGFRAHASGQLDAALAGLADVVGGAGEFEAELAPLRTLDAEDFDARGLGAMVGGDQCRSKVLDLEEGETWVAHGPTEQDEGRVWCGSVLGTVRGLYDAALFERGQDGLNDTAELFGVGRTGGRCAADAVDLFFGEELAEGALEVFHRGAMLVGEGLAADARVESAELEGHAKAFGEIAGVEHGVEESEELVLERAGFVDASGDGEVVELLGDFRDDAGGWRWCRRRSRRGAWARGRRPSR